MYIVYLYVILSSCNKTTKHPFYGPFSGTTRVSRCQKGKTNLDLLEQEIVSGSDISYANLHITPDR